MDAAAADVTLDGPPTVIVFQGAAQSIGFSVALPSGATQGDLLVAGLTLGNVSAPGGPTVTPPSGWAPLDQVCVSPDQACLYLFWAIYDTTLSSPAQWQVSTGNLGVTWVVAYSGVDTTSPFESHVMGVVAASNAASTTWPSPSLTGAVMGDMLVTAFGSYANITEGSPTQPPVWSLPTGWTARSSGLNDDVRRSAIVGDMLLTQPMAAVQVVGVSNGTIEPQFVTAGMLVLKPR